MLPEHPIVSTKFVEERFDVTNEAARQVLRRLEALGILSQIDLHSREPGRPMRGWAAQELMDMVARSN
jgi:predicted ArsR family transcriptional regulator